MTLNPTNNNITTVGAAALTIAQVTGGIIARTGPTGAFTDTLPGTAALRAAMVKGTPFILRYINASANTATIAAADGLTTIAYGAGMLGATTIATHTMCELLFSFGGTIFAPTMTVTLLAPISI